jgi:hypothetical protein
MVGRTDHSAHAHKFSYQVSTKVPQMLHRRSNSLSAIKIETDGKTVQQTSHGSNAELR